MSNISILAFRDYEFIAAAVIFMYFKGNILGDILNAFSSININPGILCNKVKYQGINYPRNPETIKSTNRKIKLN